MTFKPLSIVNIVVIAFILQTGCSSAAIFGSSLITVGETSHNIRKDISISSQNNQSVPSTSKQVLSRLSYPIVDTGQNKCYDNTKEIACPGAGSAFFGQDAQYAAPNPDYTDNGNGTVTDNITGLVWQQSPETNGDGILNHSDKLTLDQAKLLPEKLNTAAFGGYNDWRLPSIKELYSLILFDGTDVSACASGECSAIPFIKNETFGFAYGDSQFGERTIDSQYLSNTLYVNSSPRGGEKLFGVNFADGRIKGYDLSMPGGSEKTFYVLCVRGNSDYGKNKFKENDDQTITDEATGLIWSKLDSGIGMDWTDSLAWVNQQNSTNYLGFNDWRLPDAKELQSILDYTRSPDTTQSPAIDPVFDTTGITNEAGQADFPAYWTATTHASSNGSGASAVYISFGRAMGYMSNTWVDVHGAGAQRSDPKSGDPATFPTGRGPQGDAIRISNFVRLVRGGNVSVVPEGISSNSRPAMTFESTGLGQNQSSGQPGMNKNDLMPGTREGTPPLEAINACSSSFQGDSCQFTTPNGIVNGTCRLIQKQLACVPSKSQQ
jgi:hypothetical protein